MSGAFGDRYGPWALVAGASVGLGAAFARGLARRGVHVAAVSRDRSRLDPFVRDLAETFRVEARAIPCDLADNTSAAVIEEATRDLDLGLYVHNAAHSEIGAFLDIPLEAHLREMAVNVEAPLGLIHRMGRRLRERRRGGIVLMSSMSAFHGAPWVAHYGATKAWTLSLGEALADELRDDGIDVLVACAGITRTPAFLATSPRRTGLVPVPSQSPEAVAEEALDALGRQSVRITGVANRLSAFVMHRLFPRALSVRLFGRTTRKMYPSR